MKVRIKMSLQYGESSQEEIVSGIWREKEKVLSFLDQKKNRMCLHLLQKTMERETEEFLFQYDFLKKKEVFIENKETKQAIVLPLLETSYVQDEGSVQIEYQVEGNQENHKITLQWEMIA